MAVKKSTEEEVVLQPEALNEKQVALTMHQKFKEQELIEMSISPLYANEFGRVMPVSICGIYVSVPVDGTMFKVPEAFAMEIQSRIAAVNAKLTQNTRLSNVQANKEEYQGELQLIK